MEKTTQNNSFLQQRQQRKSLRNGVKQIQNPVRKNPSRHVFRICLRSVYSLACLDAIFGSLNLLEPKGGYHIHALYMFLSRGLGPLETHQDSSTNIVERNNSLYERNEPKMTPCHTKDEHPNEMFWPPECDFPICGVCWNAFANLFDHP